jgi:hypothetical protein
MSSCSDMDQYERPPRRESDERWLDEEDDLPQQPPMRRGALNERRSSTEGSGTQFMTFLLLGVLVVMVLAYTYLKDEPRPWEDDLKRAHRIPKHTPMGVGYTITCPGPG